MITQVLDRTEPGIDYAVGRGEQTAEELSYKFIKVVIYLRMSPFLQRREHA